MLEQDPQKIKWKLALRIATSPNERWLKKAAEWSLDLSSRYKDSVVEVCGGCWEAEGYRSVEPLLRHNGLHLAMLPWSYLSLPECRVGVTVQDAVTHVLDQERGNVDDMATRKHALFKRGLVSLPRVQAGLVNFSSVVPLKVRSLLEDDASSPLLQRDCTERFDGKLAFDARLRGKLDCTVGCLADLCAKGLITVDTDGARVVWFKKKTVGPPSA